MPLCPAISGAARRDARARLAKAGEGTFGAPTRSRETCPHRVSGFAGRPNHPPAGELSTTVLGEAAIDHRAERMGTGATGARICSSSMSNLEVDYRVGGV